MKVSELKGHDLLSEAVDDLIGATLRISIGCAAGAVVGGVITLSTKKYVLESLLATPCLTLAGAVIGFLIWLKHKRNNTYYNRRNILAALKSAGTSQSLAEKLTSDPAVFVWQPMKKGAIEPVITNKVHNHSMSFATVMTKDLVDAWNNISNPEQEARDHFIATFGDPNGVSACYIGDMYLDGRIQNQPDHISAAASLLKAFKIKSAKYTIVTLDPLFGDPRGDIILIGGPNSTYLTRIAWDFRGPNQLELNRAEDAVVPLRWWGQSNARELRNQPRAAWILENFGPVTRENWPLFDTKKGEKFICKLDMNRLVQGRDGTEGFRVLENYLLVTKVPNFVSPSFIHQVNTTRQTWPYILVFEGCQSIGTRAAELLLTNKGVGALKDAAKRIGGAQYFQAQFRVYNPTDAAGYSKFSEIDFVDADLCLNTADSDLYLTAHMRAMDAIRQSQSGVVQMEAKVAHN